MKQIRLPVLLLFLLAGCATRPHLYWNVRELVLVPEPTIALTAPGERLILSDNKQTIQKVFLSHLRITRAAKVQADLLLVDGEDPNAFAALVNGRRVIAINAAMARLVSEDVDEFAALLGHETGRWATGYVDAWKRRANRRQVVGAQFGVA